jgi:hypothetical protein
LFIATAYSICSRALKLPIYIAEMFKRLLRETVSGLSEAGRGRAQWIPAVAVPSVSQLTAPEGRGSKKRR